MPVFEVRWAVAGDVAPRLTRFVGRRQELGRLREALDAANRGQGSLVLVSGEPGVGKTRLVSELGIDARDGGCGVLMGRAYETEGMPPYLPFIEALSEHIRTQDSEQLRAELGGGSRTLRGCCRRYARCCRSWPSRRRSGLNWSATGCSKEVAEFVLRIGNGRSLMLFLDDLHWADRGTLLLLQHVARRLGEGTLLIVGTYRDAEVDARHPLAELLVEMTRQKMGSVLTLGPLDRDDTAALIEASLGRPAAPQVVDALFRAGEGNPFFTEELVRHLKEQGRDLADPEAAVGEWGIPVGVSHVINGRLARLSDEANRVLLCCAILGRNLSPERLAASTGIDESRVFDCSRRRCQRTCYEKSARGSSSRILWCGKRCTTDLARRDVSNCIAAWPRAWRCCMLPTPKPIKMS